MSMRIIFFPLKLFMGASTATRNDSLSHARRARTRYEIFVNEFCDAIIVIHVTSQLLSAANIHISYTYFS